MPITHDVQQGTPEWDKVRIGIPTASSFDKIITGGGDPSKQWEVYANKLLAEEIVGHPIESFQKTGPMQEGNDREAESVAFYELKRSVDTVRVGFVTDNAKTMGCSPDRLIGTDGLLETKNPLASTHVGYLLDGKLDRAYWPQVQGQLLITERKWVDIVSYFPELPELIIRVPRDVEYIEAMKAELQKFNSRLQTKRNNLIKAGYLQGEVKDPAAIVSPVKKDKWAVLAEEIIEGMKTCKNRATFSVYLKNKNEDINSVTMHADEKTRSDLAASLNAYRKGLEQSANLGAG